jgi:hypothetical protein
MPQASTLGVEERGEGIQATSKQHTSSMSMEVKYMFLGHSIKMYSTMLVTMDEWMRINQRCSLWQGIDDPLTYLVKTLQLHTLMWDLVLKHKKQELQILFSTAPQIPPLNASANISRLLWIDTQAKPSCVCHTIVEINGSVPPTSDSCFAKTYVSLYTASSQHTHCGCGKPLDIYGNQLLLERRCQSLG